jgi:hypothetical protein
LKVSFGNALLLLNVKNWNERRNILKRAKISKGPTKTKNLIFSSGKGSCVGGLFQPFEFIFN